MGAGKSAVIAALAIAVVVVAAVFIFNQPSKSPLMTLPDSSGDAVVADNPPAAGKEQATAEINPSSYAIRQRYFEEAFVPRREQYDLFEKAAKFLGIPLEKVPEYFSLESEKEIFEQLPSVPKDFSEIAYLLASGRSYEIEGLSEGYFLQPEFYPGFSDNGIKYWTEPNPNYWTTNGYGAYPADQFDTLSKSGRKEFVAVVFFYSGYGVQTYQGTTIIPTAESLEYFDIKVEPNTFLLDPTFPKFSGDWARKIVIRGTLKENAPPGDYTIGFLVVPPPKEKREEWAFKYRNLYFDAASSVAPSRFPFQFFVTVVE